MAITAAAAGILNVLQLEAAPVPGPVRWLTTGAAAAVLIIIGAIELTLRPHPAEPTDVRVSTGLKVAGGAGALALGLFGGDLSGLALLAGLLLLVLVQMVYGAYVWFTSPVSEASGHGAG
jgi:hypothetical protein